jgi:hypothetical protein
LKQLSQQFQREVGVAFAPTNNFVIKKTAEDVLIKASLVIQKHRAGAPSIPKPHASVHCLRTRKRCSAVINAVIHSKQLSHLFRPVDGVDFAPTNNYVIKKIAKDASTTVSPHTKCLLGGVTTTRKGLAKSSKTLHNNTNSTAESAVIDSRWL